MFIEITKCGWEPHPEGHFYSTQKDCISAPKSGVSGGLPEDLLPFRREGLELQKVLLGLGSRNNSSCV